MVRHRRAMFEEMGFRGAAVLNGVEELSREYFGEGLRIAGYGAWLAEDFNGQVVGRWRIVNERVLSQRSGAP
jgi:hypothetical protein